MGEVSEANYSQTEIKPIRMQIVYPVDPVEDS